MTLVQALSLHASRLPPEQREAYYAQLSPEFAQFLRRVLAEQEKGHPVVETRGHADE